MRRPNFGRRSPVIPPTPMRALGSPRRCLNFDRARKVGPSMQSAVRARATCAPALRACPHGSAAFDPTAPYLAPPTAAARRWGERLARLPAPKVGLCWGGNPRPDFVDANRIDARRSMTLERLAGLGRIPGITFVSLQKGAAAA